MTGSTQICVSKAVTNRLDPGPTMALQSRPTPINAAVAVTLNHRLWSTMASGLAHKRSSTVSTNTHKADVRQPSRRTPSYMSKNTMARMTGTPAPPTKP